MLTEMLMSGELEERGLAHINAGPLASMVNEVMLTAPSPIEAWQAIATHVLQPHFPVEIHRYVHAHVFAEWDAGRGPRPAWAPTAELIAETNLAALLAERQLDDYAALHRWSIEHRAEFWGFMIERLGIRFSAPPKHILSPSSTPQHPRWLEGAAMNIADSCFTAPADRVAIRSGHSESTIQRVTYGELEALSARVANGLVALGFEPGDAIAIALPMTPNTIAIYLGIIRMGGVVVSIADSFAAAEIATRLAITGAKAIFTRDHLRHAKQRLSLYDRIVEADAPRAIVLACDEQIDVELRPGDVDFEQFLRDDETFNTVARRPDDPCNVLFSSGTTGHPKAIPWTHATPIKAAVDVQGDDVLCSPITLGWMMGPWQVFGGLINGATLALYDGPPTGRGFCRFVQDVEATMLGVVPSLIKAWRDGHTTQGLDWSAILRFQSTGECSNVDDMFWLMSQAGYAPVIEYCGGTELGGAYLTGTMTQPAAPSTFTTPTVGLDIVLLDPEGLPTDEGEVFLLPPAIGLSQTLLNFDHDALYYDGVPEGPNGQVLRRHRDRMRRLPGGAYQALGRADNAMILGGMRVTSAEIERAVIDVEPINEVAAVGVRPASGGPERLVIFVVLRRGYAIDLTALRAAMQAMIDDRLNPLFRIDEVIVIESLPRTASNKIMHHKLRQQAAALG